MPIITASKTQPRYDVIVVGSGAGGGQTAYALTMEGVKVLMLEAGRNYDPEKETPMFNLPTQAPLRGSSTTDKPNGFYDATIDGGVDMPGEPYTNASGNSLPYREVFWWRARMLGGRTNHFNRVVLRAGPDDLRQRALQGVGADWPIPYQELAHYYDRVEMLIGVFGSNDGIDNTPDSSPGVLLPPPRMKTAELHFRKHLAPTGIRVVSARRAVLSVPLDYKRLPAKLHPNNRTAQRLLAEAMRARAACFWATDCRRGCSIKANYQSPTVQLPPALASGNLDIVPDAMVREVLVDRSGKATGVLYIDKKTGNEMRVSARVVVLAGGSYESTRMLLNSRSNRFPDGLGNTHGRLGRYITATVGSPMSGQVPALENLPPMNEEGSGEHAYIPWWRAADQRMGKLDFPSGYHVQIFHDGQAMPAAGRNIAALTRGSYGQRYKEAQRRYYGSFVNIYAQAGMIPNDDTRIDLDPALKDRWGIPVLRFHWKWSDHDANVVRHQQRTMAEIMDAIGARADQAPESNGYKAIRQPSGTHEVGGANMGSAPENSVTNQYGQVWDAPNVVVSDGALFPGSPHKNPTLTILALAWRNADHILDELKKGNV